VAGIAAVVARDELELLAEHAARGVDLIDRELEPLPVWLEKRRLGLVAVELADPERLLGANRAAGGGEKHAGERCEQDAMANPHDLTPLSERGGELISQKRSRRHACRKSSLRLMGLSSELASRGYDRDDRVDRFSAVRQARKPSPARGEGKSVCLTASLRCAPHRSRMRSISGFCWRAASATPDPFRERASRIRRSAPW